MPAGDPALDGLPHVAGVTHRLVDAGGVRVHVAEAGTGPPIVLLHGWPQHWYCWRHLIPTLAEHHRVICPDLRGHGWSDAPASGYDKEQLATDLLALLDALELDRVRLVGHDWGGFAGFLACLRAPERIERFMALAIVHPWVRARFEPLAIVAGTYQVVLATPGLGPWSLRARRGGLARYLLRAGSRGALPDDAIASYAERLSHPDRAHASSLLYRTFLRTEMGALLRGRYRDVRLKTPTVLLAGARDPVVTAARVRGFEPYADSMRVEVIPRAGHFLPEEVPETVLAHAGEALALVDRPA